MMSPILRWQDKRPSDEDRHEFLVARRSSSIHRLLSYSPVTQGLGKGDKWLEALCARIMEAEKLTPEGFSELLLSSELFTNLVRDLDDFKASMQSEVTQLAKDLSFAWEARKDMELSLAFLEVSLKDLRKELDRGLRQVDNESQRFESFTSEMTRISTAFDEIFTDLKLKASMKDLSQLEKRFSFMCPMTTAQKMQYELDEKALGRDLENLREELEALKAEIASEFCKKNELKEEVTRVTNHCTEALKPYAKEVDSINRFRDGEIAIRNQGKSLAHDIGVLSQSLSVTNANILQIRGVLDTKSTVEEMKKVELAFGDYSTIHDLSKFKKEISTLMRKCDNRLEEFRASISGQDQILARYDELLLDKASKLDLKDVNSKIRLISKHVDFEKKVEETDRILTETADRLELLSQRVASMDKNISEALQVTRNVKSEKKDILYLKDKVAAFQEMFELKADKVDLMKVSERKANADDLHQTLQSIDILHRLMKMSAVLLNHTLKGMFAKPQDSKNADIARKDWLLKHAEIVVNWAHDFSPLQPDSKIPEESLAFAPPSPLSAAVPLVVESPKFGSTHRRLQTRSIKLPSIDTSF